MLPRVLRVRSRRGVVTAMAVVSLTGCGGADFSMTPPPCLGGGIGALHVRLDKGRRNDRAPSSLAVFRALQTRNDHPPDGGSFRSAAHNGIGHVLPETTRLAVATGDLRIYVAKTDTGAICEEIDRADQHEGGSCHTLPFGWDVSRRDCSSAILSGVIPDGVVAVIVRANGARYRAHVGRNAYALRIPLKETVSVVYLLRYRDGAEVATDAGLIEHP